jgi:hypothetical protein
VVEQSIVWGQAESCADDTISDRGGLMANLSSIMKQLRKERDRVEKQLSGLNAALTAFAGVYGGSKPSRKRRKMSAQSRAKIAAAQRARWAKYRKSAKK